MDPLRPFWGRPFCLCRSSRWSSGWMQVQRPTLSVPELTRIAAFSLTSLFRCETAMTRKVVLIGHAYRVSGVRRDKAARCLSSGGIVLG